MLVKIALDAKFDVGSYSFRSGYYTFDAKWCIAIQLQRNPKYFLDANIEECFDNIDHRYLLNKPHCSRMFKR